MKKILSKVLIITTFLMILTGCSSNNTELVTERVTEMETKGTTEKPTEKPTENVTEPETIIEYIEPYKRGEALKIVGIVKTQPTKTAVNCTNFQLISNGELINVIMSSDLDCNIEINNTVEIDGVYNGLATIEAYDTQKEVVVICLYGKSIVVTATEPQTEAPTQPPTEKPTEPQTETPTEKIEILKEYTYSDGFWYTYHFVVVKNVSNIPLSIDTDTLAYGENGSLISVGSGNIDIVEPGCTTIYYESFETTDKIAKYETTTKIKRPSYYKYGISNLSYTMTDIKNGKIIQVTNNGAEPIEFVKGYLLYFKDGEIVGWDDEYFTDDDFELKPGKTISQQYSIYDEYDSVEFYLTGRK